MDFERHAWPFCHCLATPQPTSVRHDLPEFFTPEDLTAVLELGETKQRSPVKYLFQGSFTKSFEGIETEMEFSRGRLRRVERCRRASRPELRMSAFNSDERQSELSFAGRAGKNARSFAGAMGYGGRPHHRTLGGVLRNQVR